jgi:hypothetical protein
VAATFFGWNNRPPCGSFFLVVTAKTGDFECLPFPETQRLISASN